MTKLSTAGFEPRTSQSMSEHIICVVRSHLEKITRSTEHVSDLQF